MGGVDYRVEKRIALLRVENPPVNALSHGVRAGLMDGLKRAAADPGVDAVVLIGGGRTFMAGADLKEFGRPKEPPELKDVQAAMESFGKPIVAAIHGTALGGGLEVALTCHWRIAGTSAKLGLPEVKLGLIPGAGGNQRMTRLIGPENALNLILSGNPITADQALTLGIIDEISQGDLQASAVAYARRVVAERRPLRLVRELEDGIRGVDASLFADFRQRVEREFPRLLAPRKIIDAVEAACLLPAEQAFQFDAECYRQCLDSPQRNAMIHLFFAERATHRIAGIPKTVEPLPLRRAVVISTGSPAPDLAQALTAAGIRVEKLESVNGTDMLSDRASIERADIVVDVTVGAPDYKRALLAGLQQAVQPDCILAIEPSLLTLGDITAATHHSSRVIGVHFPSRAGMGNLMEIIRGQTSSHRAVATLMALAKTLGKIPVLASGGAGALSERLWQFYIASAEQLLRVGCSPERIDSVAEEFGMAIGPAALCQQSSMNIGPHPGSVATSTTGPGVRNALSAHEILAHLIYLVVNEGTRMLGDGIAQRASDIDIVSVHGCGFPKDLGGPMYWAQQQGLDKILTTLSGFEEKYGPNWAPADLLRQLVQRGQGFDDWDRETGP